MEIGTVVETGMVEIKVAEEEIIEDVAVLDPVVMDHGRGGIGKRDSRDSRPEFDPNKYCIRCSKQGHDINSCWTAAREREATNIGNSGTTANQSESSSDRPYQPSFSRPLFTAKVTRLIANSTEVQPAKNPYEWIVDSAANAYITSFKNRLNNYVEFPQTVEVKGFGGKLETAYGKGTITLTDFTGHKITLRDVVYVPESPDQILSLMKFRRENKADFYFSDLEEFIITTPNGFTLTGKSVDDILHMWTQPSAQAYAVTTHSGSKRQRINDRLALWQ
jgi:hypothetical protein